jgi:hypothetical protein
VHDVSELGGGHGRLPGARGIGGGPPEARADEIAAGGRMNPGGLAQLLSHKSARTVTEAYGWKCYGCYQSYRAACHAATYLQQHGYDTRIKCCDGYYEVWYR